MHNQPNEQEIQKHFDDLNRVYHATEVSPGTAEEIDNHLRWLRENKIDIIYQYKAREWMKVAKPGRKT